MRAGYDFPSHPFAGHAKKKVSYLKANSPPFAFLISGPRTISGKKNVCV